MQAVIDFYIVVFFRFMPHYVCIFLLLACLSFKLLFVNLSIFNKRIYCIGVQKCEIWPPFSALVTFVAGFKIKQHI